MSFSERTRSAAAVLRDNPLVRALFIALGLTQLYLVWVIKPVMEPSQYRFYHWLGSAASFYLPAIQAILVAWLFFTGLLLLARKPGRLRFAIWTGLGLFLSCVLIKLNIFYHRFDSETLVFACAAAVTLLFTVSWRPSYAERFERILAPVTTILIFLGLFGVFVLCQLAWYGWRGSLLASSSTLHHQQVPATIQPHRIIWIVFDELSYQQVYEHRYPGLQLPAFDALAADSTVFTNAQPFYIYTEVVLPGLLAGKPFDLIRTSPVEPSLHNAATGKWQTFQQHDTVFQDALNQGYSTAVAGWYNPYCRILPAVLDSCYWGGHSAADGAESSDSVLFNPSTTAALLVQMTLGIAPPRVSNYLRRLLHIPTQEPFLVNSRKTHIQDYLDLDARSNQLLRNHSYGFVLLHLPVPHPLGIYNRHTGQFTTGASSYIDNLALADKCLAGIRQTLEQTGEWDSSTIVLMGDHGWRTKQIWRVLQMGWTPEDELASHGGQYDPRPAYLVKLPNQTTAAHIDAPFQTVNTRKLFDALMAHQINTPTDLAAWAHTTH